jgi:predicted RNA-binding protein YlqC (UPF0109 family)
VIAQRPEAGSPEKSVSSTYWFVLPADAWPGIPQDRFGLDIRRPADCLEPEKKGSRTMKKIIEVIAQALVDYPDQVSVREIGGAHTSILELTVAKADIGKVIGKQGRTVSALRTILSAASAKTKKRAVLEVVE